MNVSPKHRYSSVFTYNFLNSNGGLLLNSKLFESKVKYDIFTAMIGN
jgi:hypothetical protein